MNDKHQTNRQIIDRLRRAQYNWDEAEIRSVLDQITAPEAIFRLAHPFGDMVGGSAFYDSALEVLQSAWPDVERRDWIVISGDDEQGTNWVGCGGHYVGTFIAPFLDIPPTGHYCHMRFHDFYRIEGGKVVEYQGIWDIPEVMMQAGAWPMAPSLGREFCIPGPSSGDGLVRAKRDCVQSRESQQHVIDMLAHMKKHPAEGGPDVMEMPRFWDHRMNWYGPAGIGTGRGIEGFRNWHQIPFLNAMPDRGARAAEITHHFFGDNNYCAVTGWPNMLQTVTHDGWMGISPQGQEISMRSLDFWRIEDGKIRENWVLVDILDVYRQLGVDVFARLREFNKARNLGQVPLVGGRPRP